MGHDYSKVPKYDKAPKPGRPLQTMMNPLQLMISLERSRQFPNGLTPQEEEDYQEHIRLFRLRQEDPGMAQALLHAVFRRAGEGCARALQGVAAAETRRKIAQHVEAILIDSFDGLPYRNMTQGERPVQNGYSMPLALAPAATTSEVQLLERSARYRCPHEGLEQQSDCFRRFAVEALASTETEEAVEACLRLLADVRDKATRTMAAEVLKQHTPALLKEKCQALAQLTTGESISHLLTLSKSGSKVQRPGLLQRWRFRPVIAEIHAIAGSEEECKEGTE